MKVAISERFNFLSIWAEALYELNAHNHFSLLSKRCVNVKVNGFGRIRKRKTRVDKSEVSNQKCFFFSFMSSKNRL